MARSLDNEPTLKMVTNEFITLPNLMDVEFNGKFVGTLADAGFRNVYRLALDESLLSLNNGGNLLRNNDSTNLVETSPQLLRVTINGTSTVYSFDSIGLGTTTSLNRPRNPTSRRAHW